MSTAVGLGVTQQRVLASEWTKLRSLRSSLWSLGVSAALMVGLALLLASVTVSQYDTFSKPERAAFDPVVNSLSGALFAQLTLGVLGVVLVTGEYGCGMIRATLTVVPRRLPVLIGKVGVVAAVVLPLMLLSCLLSVAIGQSVLGELGVPLLSVTVLGSVLGAAVYLTLAAVLGVLLGWVLRTTAAGIATFVGAFFVAPLLMNLLPRALTSHVEQFLPSNAGGSLFGASEHLQHELSPVSALLVLATYTAVLGAAAAIRLLGDDV